MTETASWGSVVEYSKVFVFHCAKSLENVKTTMLLDSGADVQSFKFEEDPSYCFVVLVLSCLYEYFLKNGQSE